MKKYLILAAALCMGFSLSVFADDQKPADTSASATTTEQPAATDAAKTDGSAMTTDKTADKKAADKKTEKKCKKAKKAKKHAKKMKKDEAAAPATTDGTTPAPEATK